MKDPAVLFYTQDFITGTLLMTDEQRGKYILLLCLQHQNGKLAERDMLKICGEYDADIWSKFYEEDGYFYNKRMLIETEKRNSYTESRRKNLQKKPHMDVHMEPHMENENEDVNKDIDESKEKREELLKKREEKFNSDVLEFNEYPKEMLLKFINYWTEKNRSGSKMRFELEKTFEIKRRLVTWASRDTTVVKTKTPLNYDEILKLSEKNPDIWKDYKSVLRPGERKAIFIPL